MFFLFFLIWLFFAARFNIEVLIAGVAVSAVVFFFARVHLGYSLAADRKIVRLVFRVLRYALTVVWEAAKANVAVLKIVFSRAAKVEEHIMYFRIKELKSDLALVVLANSYTLAPGSVTVTLDEDGVFCLHFLDRQFTEGVTESPLIGQLQKMEESVLDLPK
ncbi:MAG: Na+/H+ antiporter subunit E [Spirochaetes bacterium]|nr:Na+/H+ antiporter subunit E [Spirochaetota bacterium]